MMQAKYGTPIWCVMPMSYDCDNIFCYTCHVLAAKYGQ